MIIVISFLYYLFNLRIIFILIAYQRAIYFNNNMIIEFAMEKYNLIIKTIVFLI